MIKADLIIDENFDAGINKLLMSKDDGKTWEKVNIVRRKKQEEKKTLSDKIHNEMATGREHIYVLNVKEALKEFIDEILKFYPATLESDFDIMDKAKKHFGGRLI